MLLCLSSSYRNASFELLERLSLTAPDAITGLVTPGGVLAGAVVLATCNRFEAYLDAAKPVAALGATLDVLAQASGLSPVELRAAVQVHEADDVAEHVFSVSSGLESVVIGEDEIAGQVSRALDRARRDGTTSRDLERLFQRATRTSRDIRSATDLGGRDRGLVRLALRLVASRVADWSTASVLVVGTGRYAATTVAALRSLGATDIRVFSRTGRAPAFALKHGVVDSRDFEVDVVITCTTNTLLGAEWFTGDRRRIVVDLGLPRNIDPAVAGLAGVELLDLETISLHAPLTELSAHEDARALAHQAAEGFAAERAAEPSIVALRGHVLGLLDAELARAAARGSGPETETALRHLTGVLLHEPSLRARLAATEGRGAEYEDALETVYGIRPADPIATPTTAERAETA